MNKAIISLGSNIDPDKNIQRAKELLGEKFHVLAESPFKVTKPIGEVKQADFLNGTLLIETKLGVHQCKCLLNEIESVLGRDRFTDRFGPRTIDLDIVVWNDRIIDSDFHDRDYLQQSVLALAPDLKY